MRVPPPSRRTERAVIVHGVLSMVCSGALFFFARAAFVPPPSRHADLSNGPPVPVLLRSTSVKPVPVQRESSRTSSRQQNLASVVLMCALSAATSRAMSGASRRSFSPRSRLVAARGRVALVKSPAEVPVRQVHAFEQVANDDLASVVSACRGVLSGLQSCQQQFNGWLPCLLDAGHLSFLRTSLERRGLTFIKDFSVGRKLFAFIHAACSAPILALGAGYIGVVLWDDIALMQGQHHDASSLAALSPNWVLAIAFFGFASALSGVPLAKFKRSSGNMLEQVVQRLGFGPHRDVYAASYIAMTLNGVAYAWMSCRLLPDVYPSALLPLDWIMCAFTEATSWYAVFTMIWVAKEEGHHDRASQILIRSPLLWATCLPEIVNIAVGGDAWLQSYVQAYPMMHAISVEANVLLLMLNALASFGGSLAKSGRITNDRLHSVWLGLFYLIVPFFIFEWVAKAPFFTGPHGLLDASSWYEFVVHGILLQP